jgi:MoaA/NifB/PqqE/SkfB family radical SAM enzyme
MLAQRNLKMRCGPFGVHFFYRHSGVNIFCDELRVPAALWASAPRQISIALTNACDLSCPYCYAPKHHASLKIQQVTRWLHEVDDHGSLGIGFGGGEPTLHPEFVEICQTAARETMLAVTFTTHGHRIDRAMASALRGAVHFVRVSMDGVGPTYEALRKRSFAHFRHHLDIIRTIGPFGINFVVNERTASDLDEALRFAVEAGAREFLLLPEQPVRNLGGISPGTKENLHRWVRRYTGSLPLCINESDGQGLPICRIAGETGLRAYVHIDANGNLKRSSFDRHGVSIAEEGILAALRMLQLSHKEN